MDLASDLRDVFNAIMAAIEGKSFVANGQSVSVPTTFANRQPELRNARTDPSYPSLTVRLFPGVESSMRVNEPVQVKLTVSAAAPYLDGVKVPTLALLDGQTFRITRWYEQNGLIASQEHTVVLSTADFTNIAAATPIEIASVLGDQLPGVDVTLRAGNTVRLAHDTPGAGSMLQVTGGTAAALIGTFPTYQVIGRDAGQEMRRHNPPIFYNFLFYVVQKSAREDHFALVSRLVERLFIIRGSHNERVIEIAGNPHAVERGAPVDDPMADEGVFLTTTPFTLRAVPIMLDEAFGAGDNFNGGNYDGTGRQPFRQAPLEISLALDVGTIE